MIANRSFGPIVVERGGPADVDGTVKLTEANEEEHGGALSGHLEAQIELCLRAKIQKHGTG